MLIIIIIIKIAKVPSYKEILMMQIIIIDSLQIKKFLIIIKVQRIQKNLKMNKIINKMILFEVLKVIKILTMLKQ